MAMAISRVYLPLLDEYLCIKILKLMYLDFVRPKKLFMIKHRNFEADLMFGLLTTQHP